MSPSKQAKDTADKKADTKKKAAARKAPAKKQEPKVDPDTVGLLADPVPPAPHPDRPYADES